VTSLVQRRGGAVTPITAHTTKTGRVLRPLAHVPPSLVSLLAGALIWELIGRLVNVSFFPPLTTVLARLLEMVRSGLIVAPLWSSLINLVVGFGLSLVCGVAVGVLMGRYPKVEAALGIYVYALLTAPALVFAPIFFSILGDGRGSILAVVVMYSLFIMIINTADAIRGVPNYLVEMGRSYGATESQILWRIIIPAATPMIMAGVRLGAGRAVTGMINGEMFIAVVGLGAVVTEAGGRFDGASVLAVLLVIIAVAVAAVGLVQAVDRRLTAWLPKTSRE
jgi:ABC-type nitrate/sulfonate/bicarbonate transport system permease component